MKMIGIDLGTTNSLASVWQETGPVIIPNALGKNLTPSVVSIGENNEIIVGEPAKERLITNPERTASCFKRFMGTEKVYHLEGHRFTPEELSSFVLRALKEDAEVFLGEPITEAVISVPAYFNDKQRNATKRAAEFAGLHVERLINEPSAAAIAYGLADPEQEAKFVVLDLGGGTFDVSILEMFEGVMEVHAIAGDNYLGGEDFTNLLINHFAEQTNLNLETLSAMERSILYKQAESCKLALSLRQSGIMSLMHYNQEYSLTITPEGYENISLPLLKRLLKPIEKALRDSKSSASEMDNVILIGGATRMPALRSHVSKMFGKLPYANINPDETVALGAAIQAAFKEKQQALNEVVFTDVCPHSLGVDMIYVEENNKEISDMFSPIIERNTTIPCSRVQRYNTSYHFQSAIKIGIYQGESRKATDNLKLGELEVKVPRAKAGVEKVDVRFTYDINGLIEVEVTVCSTGVKKQLVIEQTQGIMTEEEKQNRLKALSAYKIHPRDRLANKLLLERGNRLYEETLGQQREYLGLVMGRFESILERQNDFEIRKEANELTELLNNLEGSQYDFDE